MICDTVDFLPFSLQPKVAPGFGFWSLFLGGAFLTFNDVSWLTLYRMSDYSKFWNY